MNGNLDNVTASFQRCRQDPDFIETFYDIFLSTSPEVSAMFAKTNFKVQRLMLRESLLTMLCFNLGIAGTQDELVRLGRKHEKLGIKPEFYPVWLDSLCNAVRCHDPKYSHELGIQWRDAIQKGIDAMLAAYEN